MRLLKQTERSYYNNPDVYAGNYQFTSLEDIINQFLVVYVGEEKIINKVNRTDVAFHAQRAMQELSFDTFKSIKSQEIVLPPTNTMILPHDYVNYTKLSWSDSSGIKHPLYPTSQTSNPFKIQQEEDGSYDFTYDATVALINSSFTSALSVGWNSSNPRKWSNLYSNGTIGSHQGGHTALHEDDEIVVSNGQLKFTQHVAYHGFSGGGGSPYQSSHYAVWQQIDLTDVNYVDLSAYGTSSASGTGKNAGIIRIGLTTTIGNASLYFHPNADQSNSNWYPSGGTFYTPGMNFPGVSGGVGNQYTMDTKALDNTGAVHGYNPNKSNPNQQYNPSINMREEVFNLQTTDGTRSYIEFSSGNATSTLGELNEIDVTNIDTAWVLIVSSGEQTAQAGAASTNAMDNIKLAFDADIQYLQTSGDSTTWTNYQSNTPSENTNQNYDYDTDQYDLNKGQRVGLDPQHAQTNGSFYIDNLKGLIHFSSNVSGKTVILDYISDSLGTSGETKVHKFAEEAMYRWILHAVASGRIQTQQLVPRLKKEKIAAVRQAKLRLSNVKLEELTQILRGKSKHIKH